MTIPRNLSILAEGASSTGVLAATNGGTGIASYTIGDLLYASGTTTLSKLADVATGSVLISGGVGVAPSWSATPTITSLSVGSTLYTPSGGIGVGINIGNGNGLRATQTMFTSPYGATNVGNYYYLNYNSGWVYNVGSGSTYGGALYFDGIGGNLIYVNTASSGSDLSAASIVERMRIDSSGNVGIGTSSPSASAILDAQSTTKGVRFPNMTTTQKNAVSSPAAGLVVFDTTLAKLCVYSGSAWQTITSV